MILSNEEVKTCLLWVLQSYLDKYDMHIDTLSISLNHQMMIKANIEYGSNMLAIQGKCDVIYQDYDLILKNIEGQVNYSFISMNLIQLLQQYMHHEYIAIINNAIYCHIPLPIKELILEDEHLHLKLIEM